MERIAAGDPAALESLFKHHAGSAMAVCMAVLRDRSEAEEVVEDAFFEIWRIPQRYDPDRGEPLAYLVTLARSRAIDRLRKLGRRRSHELTFEAPEDLAAPEAEAASPLQDIVAAERRARVRKAFEALDPAQRRMVELAFFRGLTHSEIASTTGEPLGTVKTRVRRGLIRLRDLLAPSGWKGDAS